MQYILYNYACMHVPFHDNANISTCDMSCMYRTSSGVLLLLETIPTDIMQTERSTWNHKKVNKQPCIIIYHKHILCVSVESLHEYRYRALTSEVPLLQYIIPHLYIPHILYM